jgi:hypothetical protein
MTGIAAVHVGLGDRTLSLGESGRALPPDTTANSTEKTVPCPGWLWTLSVPPCPSTMARQREPQASAYAVRQRRPGGIGMSIALLSAVSDIVPADALPGHWAR